MEYAQNLFERLSSSLGAIPFPEDLRMQVGGFMTFADFLFDGTLVDVIMLSKIFSSIERVHEFQKKISQLHTYLKKLS